MATVASIVTNLRANTGQFENAFRAGQATLKRFTSQAQALQQRLDAVAKSDGMNELAKSFASDVIKKQMTVISDEQDRFAIKTAERVRHGVSGLAVLEQRMASIPGVTTKATKSFHEWNNELKAVLGRGSALKDVLEIAAGGGAIVGLNMAANAIGDMGKAMSDLATASATAGTNMDDFITRFVQSIPIIGGVHNAVKGVYDLLAGVDTGAMSAKTQARNKFEAAGSEDVGYRLREAQVQEFLAKSGNGTATEQALARANAANEMLNIALERRLDSVAEVLGRGTAAFERLATEERNVTGIERNANNIAARTQIDEIQEKARAAVWDGVVKSVQNQIETVKNFANKVGGAAGSGLGSVADAVSDRIEQEAVRRQREADREAREAAARRRSFVDGAMGIFERLREQESAPIQFTGGTQAGSQAEFESRQRALVGGAMQRTDEKKLMEEAVKKHQEEIDQLKEIRAGIRDVARNLKVADFN